MGAKRRGRRKKKGIATGWKVLIAVLIVLVVAGAGAAGWLLLSSAENGVAAEKKMLQTGDLFAEKALETADEIRVEEVEEVLVKAAEEQNKKDKLVVIDAGHQAKQNSEKEPIGPGATETKAKVSSGTAGKYTGVPEYQVTLEVSLQLQEELEERGYQVIMVRTTNDVNISNSERAQIANENHADAFVRIHCDGSEDTSVNGAMTICMTPKNPYCAELYKDSRKLAEEVLDHLCQETGAKKNKVWETDTMSGINWCEVPVTIVEMGYMSNKEEDQKLVSSDYQKKLVKGIADGIEAYLDSKE